MSSDDGRSREPEQSSDNKNDPVMRIKVIPIVYLFQLSCTLENQGNTPGLFILVVVYP